MPPRTAQPAWAAKNPQVRARVMMKFLEIIAKEKEALAHMLSMEHGKTIPDSLGDIQRGVEVVEFACGVPHLMKGEFTEGAGPGIDMYSIRQPVGVAAGITPFNFPAMIPVVEGGAGHCLRQCLHSEAIGARSVGAAAGSRNCSSRRDCRPAFSMSSTATRKRSMRSSTIPTSRHRFRRLDANCGIRLFARHGAWQTSAILRRGEEPYDHHA